MFDVAVIKFDTKTVFENIADINHNYTNDYFAYDFEDVEIMQSTNIKSIKSQCETEIFDGDIIKFKDSVESEVIGNIYQTPELIEG